TRAKIGGKDADLYDPPGGRPRFGVLFLHDFDLQTLAGNNTFTRLFAALRLACVCPHGRRCWWGDRACAEFDPHLTPERYLLDAVLPFFGQHWGVRPPPVALLGIAMRGQR